MNNDIVFDVQLSTGQIVCDCTFKEVKKPVYLDGFLIYYTYAGNVMCFDSEDNVVGDLKDIKIISAYNTEKDLDMTTLYQRFAQFNSRLLCSGIIKLDS